MGRPVVHFEVLGPDAAALRTFYGTVFDWTIDTNNPMDYGIVDNGGHGINGGVAGAPDGSAHATFYVEVDDPAATLRQIESLGGQTIMEVMEVPGGPTIAMFTDPAGNRIGLVKAQSM